MSTGRWVGDRWNPALRSGMQRLLNDEHRCISTNVLLPRTKDQD